MQLTLPDFSRARVLVAGDVMLDRYWQGAATRISPEAPVPVVRVADRTDRAGGAGNVALNITALGAPCILIAATGDDEPAAALARCLSRSPQLDCQLIRHPEATTITKLRVLSHSQQLIRLDFEASALRVELDKLTSSFTAQLPLSKVVVLSDYAKGTLTSPQALIQAARQTNTPVVVDPKGTDFRRYAHATLLTPNRSEFEAVAGPCNSDEDFATRGLKLCETHELDAVLITRSERGMTLVQRGVKALHLPTHAQEVFDVTGAGDTVIATLAACLAASCDLESAARIANYAAGIAVRKVGTATVSPAELAEAIHADQDTVTDGIIGEDALQRAVRQAQAAGQRVILTNGCFDLLHPGHIRYLKEARSLGDKLIVAVNSDDSVRRLKGEERPINPLEHRLVMLSALSCVDWVIPFPEDTPERLICALLPDVLIKGGDYRPEEIAGHDCVKTAGGEVVVTDFLDGYSTTRIIEKIQRHTE